MAAAMKNDHRQTTTVTIERDVREYHMYCRFCDFMWLVATFEGWLKMLEWISTFLAFVFICTSYYGTLLSFFPEYNFMVFVGVAAHILVTIHIALKMTHVFETLPVTFTHPFFRLTCCVLGVLAFLSSSSVVLARSNHLTLLEMSAASGYVAMSLFLLESCCLLFEWRRKKGQATESTANTVEIMSGV